ncbi:hypothetical protein IGI37_000423 [Enterococcus sp. AZ194]|uniref:tyrosine-type recombinase/integrase n=1 Tax=Enterococcus sp. AZ194 TaxID=2774629 RepID=UPI003F251BFE
MDITKKIKEYKTKKGDKRFICKNAYIGTYYDGTQKITNIRGRTKTEVKNKYSKLLYEFNPEEKKKTEKPINTFKDLYDLWLPQYRKGVKESTYRGTRKKITNYVLPGLGETKLKDMNVLSLQKYYDGFMAENGTKYYHQILQIVSKIIRYGVSIGLLQDDPTEYVIKPKVVKRKRGRNYLTKEELKKLYDYLDHLEGHYINEVQKIVFRLLAQSGMRIGECTALNWSDIDFEKHTVSITKTFTFTDEGWVVGTPKNVASNRVVIIDEDTIERLSSFRKKQEDYFTTVERKDTSHIFLSRNGKVLHNGSIYDMLKRITKSAELPDINTHGLRHTHATLLFESKATAKEVQIRLGHSSIKTTLDTYTHVGEDISQKTVDTLMDYLTE